MKKYIRSFFILLLLFVVLPSYSAKASGLDEYTDFSTDRPWVGIGVRYALFSQTNDLGPTTTFGNAVDTSVEIFLTRFLTIYTGYQFMTYDWDKQPRNVELFDNKLLLGGRLYFAGIFIGGGGYSTWTTVQKPGKDINENYWGGYIDFGYSYNVITDFLTFETGARIYFTPDSAQDLITPAYTNEVPTRSTKNYMHWDWFVGLKLLV